jgi:hypothetical protein
MLNPNARLQVVVPAIVTARTWAYRAKGTPVNHGRAMSIETAGTRSGAMTVCSAGSVEADDVVELVELGEVVVEDAGADADAGELAGTAAHALWRPTVYWTFDQISELCENDLLVASSNS